jgi:aryl-alcohol dehydrogenase-like predicted oxidoreductase
MKLNAFRTLGRSGLRGSPIALGAMTFGDGDWGADDVTAAVVHNPEDLGALMTGAHSAR